MKARTKADNQTYLKKITLDYECFALETYSHIYGDLDEKIKSWKLEVEELAKCKEGERNNKKYSSKFQSGQVALRVPSQYTLFRICLDPLDELNLYNYMIVPNVMVQMLESHWKFLLYCLKSNDIGDVRLDLIEDFLYQVAKEFCIFKPKPDDEKQCKL
jgi:hypothetical protein